MFTVRPMAPSDHEEADTRMCVHIKDSLEKGARVVSVQTVDTDVIIPPLPPSPSLSFPPSLPPPPSVCMGHWIMVLAWRLVLLCIQHVRANGHLCLDMTNLL